MLRSGGRYYASTSARDNDPEIMWEGYPRSSFDADEAAEAVRSVFDEVDAQRWDARSFPLETGTRSGPAVATNFIPAERAEEADVPL